MNDILTGSGPVRRTVQFNLDDSAQVASVCGNAAMALQSQAKALGDYVTALRGSTEDADPAVLMGAVQHAMDGLALALLAVGALHRAEAKRGVIEVPRLKGIS